jgi:hypothetical protein
MQMHSTIIVQMSIQDPKSNAVVVEVQYLALMPVGSPAMIPNPKPIDCAIDNSRK